MARKKKKTASKIPAEVTAVAVTVTNVESCCCCANALQKQLCDLNLELGNQCWCVEEEDLSDNTEVEAAAAAAVTEAAAATEAKAEDNCSCENALRKYWYDVSAKVGQERWCVEEEDSSEKTEEELASVAAATEAASVTQAEGVTEAAVETKENDIRRCCKDLQKFWCDEFLKLRLRC